MSKPDNFIDSAADFIEEATNQKPDKFEEAARKAVELTDLCKLHMEYHGQQTPECTPEKRVLITPKPDTKVIPDPRDYKRLHAKKAQLSKPDTTLREDIKAILTHNAVRIPERLENDLDQILDLLLKRLPGRKEHSIVCKVNTHGHEDRQCDCSARQVNQTLAEVRAIIGGEL